MRPSPIRGVDYFGGRIAPADLEGVMNGFVLKFNRPVRRGPLFSPQTALTWMAAGLLFFTPGTLPGQAQEIVPTSKAASPEGFELVKTIEHNGSAAWTDTGIEVKPGEEYYFEAEGLISIQKDNPVATCGPEGLSLKTMQQPLTDQNLGCLIGIILTRVEVLEDKRTKEKAQRRFGERFPIGKQTRVIIPEAGRLLLAVNENVAGDNDGKLIVAVYRKAA